MSLNLRHYNKQTYRSASVLFCSNKPDSEKEFISRLQIAINENKQKKDIFIRFFQLSQSLNNKNIDENSDLNEVKNSIKSFFLKNFNIIRENDLDTIESFSIHKNSKKSRNFSNFYTKSCYDLLLDLGYSYVDIIAHSKHIEEENFFCGCNLINFQMDNLDLQKLNFSDSDLSHTNLKNSNFSGSSFRNAKINNAILIESIFAESDFTDATLIESNLTNADFSLAILKNASLLQANLKFTIFIFANLTCANLSNAKIINTNFASANLYKANLWAITAVCGQFTEANLEEANISNAQVTQSTFISANLKRANLYYSKFIKSNFSMSDLTQAMLAKSNLTESDFTDSLMSEANVWAANLSLAKFIRSQIFNSELSFCNLSNTDFSNASLERSKLYKATIINTNFSGANLKEVEISNSTDFSRAIFDELTDLSFSLKLTDGKELKAKYEEIWTEIDKNRISDPEKIKKIIDPHTLLFFSKSQSDPSILKVINTIQDRYSTTRKNVMEYLIRYILSCDEIFIKNIIEKIKISQIFGEKYVDSDLILNFVENYFFNDAISLGNKNGVSISPHIFGIALVIIQKHSSEKNYFISNNCFINQLIFAMKNCSSANPEEAEKIQSYKNMGIVLERLFLSHFPGAYDSIREILELEDIRQEDSPSLLEESMLFITPNEDNFFIITYNYYKTLVIKTQVDDVIDWKNFYYFSRPESLNNNYVISQIGGKNLKQIFIHFKLIFTPYSISLAPFLGDFIEHLRLGDFYEEQILAAFHETSSQLDLSLAVHENNLFASLRPHIQVTDESDINSRGEFSLSLRLSTAIIDVIEGLRRQFMPDLPDNPSTNYQVYVCLAAVFIRLSSSTFFGSEHSSPLPFRNFAIALLNEALQHNQMAQDQIIDWKHRLAGTANRFSCTDILFSMMWVDGIDQFSVRGLIIPPAWR